MENSQERLQLRTNLGESDMHLDKAIKELYIWKRSRKLKGLQ